MARTPREKQQVSAYDKALGLLVRREHSARELKSKLARRGLDREESALAVEKLRAKDFQNDGRFGAMLVRSRIEGGYGPRWIMAELRTHGIDEAAARVLLDAAEVDWAARVVRQLRRRYGAAPAATLAERARRAGYLLRRGFDAATVQSVTRAEGLDESTDESD